MKKILLLSDTHSLLDSFVLSHVDTVDEIWHAGDLGNTEVMDKLESLKPVRMVYGNIDGKEIRAHIPKIAHFNCEGLKVYMIHIGGHPRRYEPAVKADLAKLKPDVFISGHSHILKVQYDKNLNLLHMNPGAAGRHGFHHKRTFLKFEISEGKIENLVIVEKDK